MPSVRMNIRGDRGASMVEYGLIVAVISLMALSAVTLVGEKTDETFTAIASSMEEDGSTPAPGQDAGSEEPDDSDSGSPGGDQSPDSDQDQDDEHEQQSDDIEDAEGGEAAGDTNDPESDDGSDDSNQDEEVVEEEEAAGPTPEVTATSSDLYWWSGNEGQWKASVSYSNDTNRNQYLTLEVTQIDDKGKTTTTTASGFYVGPGGNSTHTHWSNDIKRAGPNVKGVVEVQVRVISVKTEDQNWQPYSYEVNANPTSIQPPALP